MKRKRQRRRRENRFIVVSLFVVAVVWATVLVTAMIWGVYQAGTNVGEWRLIETWTGGASAQAEWRLAETWTGRVIAPAKWKLIETWSGTVSAPVPAGYILRNFEWTDHKGTVWTWSLDIEQQRYENYQALSHRAYTAEDYRRFVTYEDNLIENMANWLIEKYFAPEDTANLILSFVQAGFQYTPDIGEYWRYPVETLVDNGDCEDKSILFASIMKTAGYDVALILFEDHAMAGVVLPNEPTQGTQEYFHWFESSGKRYYTCETTEWGWHVGDLPEEYWGKTAYVVVI